MSELYKNESWLREQYIEKERSMKEIGDECGVSDGNIWYYIHKYDIDARDRLEESKKAVSVPYANYAMTDSGHMRWTANIGNNEQKVCYVARLLAVAEYGFDGVCDKHVHHKNGIPWDNRPENIEPLTHAEHAQEHGDQYDWYKNRETPYRDEDTLRELYVEREMTLAEIGDKFGVAGTTIRDWLAKYDIPRRSRNAHMNSAND